MGHGKKTLDCGGFPDHVTLGLGLGLGLGGDTTISACYCCYPAFLFIFIIIYYKVSYISTETYTNNVESAESANSTIRSKVKVTRPLKAVTQNQTYRRAL